MFKYGNFNFHKTLGESDTESFIAIHQARVNVDKS